MSGHFIHHSDFPAVDKELRSITDDNVKFLEFNHALGAVDFDTKRSLHKCELPEFLESVFDMNDDDEPCELFIILKDIHDAIHDPKVIALIRRIAESSNFPAKIIIIDTKIDIPLELESFITLIDVPLPDDEEIRECIETFTANDPDLQLDKTSIDELIFALKGLSSFQINQVLSIAYQKGGTLDASDRKYILEEKEQMIKKSGILEMINFEESIDDIGGLERLKAWLKRKAKIFSSLEQARKHNVDIPRGVLILGMPGCGKSLTAKAAARLFNVPLLRLDVGRLMGKYVGESEENMRRALKLSEAVSPCVLWVDELEKAFAGIGGSNGDITTRLFGQFLTWMQEKKSSVFIIATANDISKLPAEFLRKGRFDELFSVDLPNENERKKILEVHLTKSKKMNQYLYFINYLTCYY
ncbi:MAG: AAA family ATPase [Synergistaceae bacterium]|nr:AAA family ATPase [Synergistaceae bacterium]